MTAKKQKKISRKAKAQTFGKELVPIALALVAISASLITPMIVKMARAFRDQRKAKLKEKKITLAKTTSAAREVQDHPAENPKLANHKLHQEGKKNGKRARRNHLLKEASVRAKVIRGNDYSKFPHPHNSK
jgi:hypothetical protein